MNKSKLKAYAPKARKDFIAAVTARANLLGLSDHGGKLEVAVGGRKGDIAIIAGREWPVKVYSQREDLIKRMTNEGFSHTVEAVAYTWFNRFAALRYMEIHDYLDHGHRALSNRAGGMPEILNHATELDLPALNKAKAIELKLAGNKDNDLYKLILVAQCNALSSAMPFLFERIDDETELLLPDNLLLTDSVIAKLVADIPEEDWQEVEIIGWLYQFYISEKKDEVIGKVVKSEDIPAATQLFTPNWIVQYLVQNSVGRLWLMANPQSTLAKEWPYYITPAEQTPEVQAQLDALIQTRMDEDGGSLNPETITVLDPACGSGHILVVAYDVLKVIYLERGYQPRAIPRLILEKNLYGLDIDDRAAQMAGFALLMKARADDRRLLTATDDAGNLQPPKLNVLSLQESKGLSVDELVRSLTPALPPLPLGEGLGEGGLRATITALVETFEHAKTFGSLIQIPYALKTHLAVLPEALALVKQSGDMYATAAADDLLPLVQQAQVLAMQFDAVVANPPYMGSKFHIPVLKKYLKENYNGYEKDVFSAFISRDIEFSKPHGLLGFMSPFVWMFIPSHEPLRTRLIERETFTSLVQLEYSGFEGATVPICAFTLQKGNIKGQKGGYVRLNDFRGADSQGPKTLEAIHNQNCGWFFNACQDEFLKIPGCPIAYWASEVTIQLFESGRCLGDVAKPRTGLNTTDNSTFLRRWHEVDRNNTNFSATKQVDSETATEKWYPFQKGGEFRKWFGNNEFVVNWRGNGEDIREATKDCSGGRVLSPELYFHEGVCWSTISSSDFSARYFPTGFIFSNAAGGIFPDEIDVYQITALTNSAIPNYVFNLMNPTLNYSSGLIAKCPLVDFSVERNFVLHAISISKADWDSYETSWGFNYLPILSAASAAFPTLKASYSKWCSQSRDSISEMKCLEEENNRFFIGAYGLENEIAFEVPIERITLSVNPAYRYGGKLTEEEQWTRFSQDTMGELVSYAIGCMMGRYSLDEPGLIYAHAGNVGFEPGRYATFPADADGIVPITEEFWFADDAPSRIREFLRTVWGPDTLEENMAWLAESLGTKASESPDDTIRRYIADKFFKDHLQTYKKRPIYWLFSSGKQGAFQALVYLHRYNESTLARMRSEYVVPLTGKMLSRIEMLGKDAESASSTATRTKINKEIEVLRKQHLELLAYDEKLRHYADMRIQLDLDDGVKVNYGKFGDLLAEVKVVTGGAGDD